MTKTVKIRSKKNSGVKARSRLDIAKSNRSLRGKKSFKFSGNGAARKLAKITLIFAAVVLVGMLAGSVYAFSWLQKQYDDIPTTEEVFPNPPVATVITDRNGVELYKVIGDFNSDLVDLNQIPEKVKWAFIVAEDAEFYNHNGFDTSGIIRCGVKYVTARGASICGGSTITQQLIKITALSTETSKVTRKVKELFVSTRVEQESSKDEILQMYLSVTSYGSNVVGLEAAADYYFNKEPGELTLAEATILASIIQNPAYLSPTKPVDGDTVSSQANVKERQLYVLEQYEKYLDKVNEQSITNLKRKAEINGTEFKEEDYIPVTLEEIETARNEELKYQPPIATDKLAGHFTDFVISELTTKNYKNGEEPFTLSELQNNGYQIQTTLDYNLQKVAEKYVKQGGNDYKYWNMHNAAVMTMVPSNGQILTMAGSKSFTGESEGCDANGENCLYNPEVNILTTPQSPGSTNKPLAYYKAYEQGKIFTGSLLPDVPIRIGSYEPKNWNSGFSGVNGNNYAESVLERSLNIPALQVVELIGVSTYIQTAREFGYSTYTDDQDLGHSVVLGGTTVLPYEHAAAFGVFANQGDYVRPEAILSIKDRTGKVIYESKPEKKRVADPAATFLLNQSLLNLNDGRSTINFDDRQVAGKTGTSESSIDNWLLMYSPDFVTLAWAGNNNNNSMDLVYGYPTFTISPWLKPYMAEIGNYDMINDKNTFARPSGVYQGGGECKSGQCLGVHSGWLIEGKTPPGNIEKKTFTVCKDQSDRLAREIDIALGYGEQRTFTKYSMPVKAWQKYLDEYLKGKNTFPTKDCDKDRTGGVSGPIFSMSNPKAGDTVNNNLKIKGTIFSTSGTLTTADVYIDGQLAGTVNVDGNNKVDQTLDITGLGLDNGVYTVSISATDSSSASNTYTASVTFGSEVSSNFTFTQSPSGTIPWAGALSQQIKVTYGGSSINTGSVVLYQIKNNSEVTAVGTMTLVSGEYVINWGPGVANENATYKFFVMANTTNGGQLKSGNSGEVTITAI
jgi:penicillin-binding protein 1A